MTRSSDFQGQPTNAADFIAESLVLADVRHVFGVGGANIEDFFAAVQRRRPDIRMVLSKHEHAAGTAADAYARLTGGLGVVCVTSGGGAMNLVHALAEARASRVPLLAVVGEPPTELQGLGAFQDTSGRCGGVDAATVFAAVSVWCTRVENVDDVPRLLAEALSFALGPTPGPAVLLLAKDRQRAELSTRPASLSGELAHAGAVESARVRQACSLLRPGPIVILAGAGVARAAAQPELAAIADALDAQVAVAPDARDAFNNHSTRFLGVCGAMGSKAAMRAIDGARACLVVGTRLPLLTRQGCEATLAAGPLISVGPEPLFLKARDGLHLEGDLLRTLRALSDELHASEARCAAASREPPVSTPGDRLLDSQRALLRIEQALPKDGVVLVDAGNTGAASAHALRIPVGCRWLLAMGMAGMGYSFGAAIGAAFASGKRCFVLAGDGAFLMNGLDVHTAVEHQLPITYLIFDNAAHGMCLVRERLLLRENAGYNAFRRSHFGAGLSAMFPGLAACDCRTERELADALARAALLTGPALISIELDSVEIPPFSALQQAAPDGVTTVSRGHDDAAD
ncbi:MAG TPA: thiamine pyrophosphate-binding protein [Polyangiaceae bacterium]